MPIFDVKVESEQVAKLKGKFKNYPPYAINKGLEAVSDYLNEDTFRESMYPPESNEPFVWSSEKQRRAYFATNGFGRGIPYSRTHELMYSGAFKVNKASSSFYITYENIAPYFKWVQGLLSQIIGHKTRGWKPASNHVIGQRVTVLDKFETAARKAWDEMDSFMGGGAPGL